MTSPRYALPDDFDLIGIIKKLQADIIALQRNNSVGNTSIDKGVFILKSGGAVVMAVGDLNQAGFSVPKKADGTSQMGFYLGRDPASGGGTILEMRDADLSDGYAQALIWYDRAGNTVFSDDTNTGWGIGRPWIGSSSALSTNAFSWPSVTGGSFSGIVETYLTIQHPKIRVNFAMFCDAGVSGEAALYINGVQYGATIAGGAGFTTFDNTVVLPASLYGSVAQVQVQARRTAGTNSAYIGLRYAIGRQT